MFTLKYSCLWFLSLNFLIINLSLIQCKFSESEPEYQRSKFKSLKCFSDNTSIMLFKQCRVKVTRNSSMLAINVTFIPRSPRPINMRATMSYKYGLIYRDVVKVPMFEACTILKNIDSLPPFARALFDSFGDSLAPILKGCPFVDVDVLLTSDVAKFPSIFPSGMYRITAYGETTNSKLFRVTGEAEIVSNIKTSF